MIVATDRLMLTPLDQDDLALYMQGGNRYETEKGLVITGRTVKAEVREWVETKTLPALQSATGDSCLFHTFWLVIEKAAQRIVAELGFKGPPDAHGEVEIGYGTMPGEEGKGYMTEAVEGLVGWATLHPSIHAVLAETSEHNPASIRIVQKNGFEQFDKKGEMLWWRKKG